MPSLAKALTLAPTSQICPVLYHAGTVLLNALLDTVPGESVLAGGGKPWARPRGWNGGQKEARCPVVRWHFRAVSSFHTLLWNGLGFQCGMCCVNVLCDPR